MLAPWGITDARLPRITSGGVNEHWRVDSPGGVYVLRRYNPRHDPTGTPYEHAVLRFIAARGWPVAPPLPDRSGRLVVERVEGRYALFAFLPGTRAPHGDLAILEAKGRLLAALHQEMAAWEGAQRPGFARVHHLDIYVRPDGFASVAELLAAVGLRAPALAAGLRAEWAANLAELARDGFDALPDQLIHFEFQFGNLLFEHGRLSALLDFDFVHLDARITDLGRVIATECLPPGATAVEPASVRAFLHGYMAVSPLTACERRLLVPVARANLLWLVVLPLSQWMVGGPASYLESARTSLATAVRLREDAGALEAVIAALAR